MEYSNAETLTELLEEKALLLSDETAYTFIYHRDGREKIFSFTFKEVHDEARRIAADLKRLGLKKGQRVLVFSSQTHDNILSLFGTLYAGGIIVIIPPPVDEQKKLRFRSVLKSAHPRFLLCNSFLAPILEKSMYPKFIPVFIMKALIRLVKGFSLFNIDESRCSSKDYIPVNVDTDDTAVLQYSSGSVSEPKGIMLSHRNIISNMRDIARTAHYEMTDPSVGFAPFFHSIGLVYHGLFNVFVGYNSINISPLAFMEKPLRLFEIASRYRAFLIAAPNSIYRLCAEVIDPEDVKSLDLSSIKAAGNGSEAIDIATLQGFSEKMETTGFSIDSFTPGYGLSETTILVSCQNKPAPVNTVRVDAGKVAENLFIECNDSSDDTREFVSSGEILESFEVRIVNPETLSLCGDKEIGEIWVQGPAVSRGYWKNEAETRKAFYNTIHGEDGFYLRTGDLGILHKNHLFVTGRIKELIIVNGKNYYPQDFELEVNGMHELKGTVSAAFSVYRNGREQFIICIEAEQDLGSLPVISKRISSLLLSKFGLAPNEILFVESDSLPRTDNRKIRRISVKEQFLGNNLKPVWTADYHINRNDKDNLNKEQSDDIDSRISRELVLNFNLESRVQSTDNLLEAGMDSLAITRFIFSIEKMFDVSIQFSDVINNPTVKNLADLIRSIREGTHQTRIDGANLENEVHLPEDICFDDYTCPDIGSVKTVFLTGTTGFLGAYLIHEILLQSDAEIFCHVRADDEVSGMLRIRKNLEDYHLWDDSMKERLIPVIGDLGEPSLGMSRKDYDRISAHADLVLHNGAQLNFLYPYELLKQVNVGSTIEAIRLCTVNKPKRLVYVSSYSVFDNPSYFDSTIDETVDTSHWKGFLLGYSQTKWVAERCIGQGRKKGLDAVIFRPGQITGDTKNGIWKATDFASQFLISSVQLGMVPDIDVFVPMTPVDYIGRAIVAIMLRNSDLVVDFHLLNRDVQTIAELTEFFKDAGLNIDRVPFDVWKAAFEKQGEENILYYFKDLISTVDSHGFTFFERYSSRQAKILCTHTEETLAPMGIKCPKITNALMVKYLESFQAQEAI